MQNREFSSIYSFLFQFCFVSLFFLEIPKSETSICLAKCPLAYGVGSILNGYYLRVFVDEPSLMDYPKLQEPFESMHSREGPLKRKNPPCHLPQVSCSSFLHLYLQPLHPPLFQMSPSIFGPPRLSPHSRSQCLLLQCHDRFLCQRITSTYFPPAV